MLQLCLPSVSYSIVKDRFHPVKDGCGPASAVGARISILYETRNDPGPLSSSGGDSGARTRSLRLAKPALSQLSYIPGIGAAARRGPRVCVISEDCCRAGALVGLGGLEPPTSRLSGVRSNQLSYRPTPSQCRGGDRARRGGSRLHCPPSPWVLREPEPGRVSEGQIGPGRCTGQAESRPQAPEREKNSARATKAR